MPKCDARVDAYIGRSAEFAQPILRFLRETVHAACPEVEETLKWGMPTFMYHGILCSMAAFKQHATFGFWKNTVMIDAAQDGAAMGQFGRITHCRDLPTKKVLTAYIRQAMKLNVEREAVPKSLRASRPAPKPPLAVPDDLDRALKKQRKAAQVFAAFTDGQRREYIEWIAAAKRAETRQRRLEQAIAWIAEGKQRNWKYMNC